MPLVAKKLVSAVTVNLTPAGTAVTIADLQGVLGAKGFLIQAYNANDANIVTITATVSFTGVVGTGQALSTPVAAGDCSGAEGRRYTVADTYSGNTTPQPLAGDRVIIQAAKAVAPGNVTFNVWALYDVEMLPGMGFGGTLN